MVLPDSRVSIAHNTQNNFIEEHFIFDTLGYILDTLGYIWIIVKLLYAIQYSLTSLFGSRRTKVSFLTNEAEKLSFCLRGAECRLARTLSKHFFFVLRSAEHYRASFLHIVRANSDRLRAISSLQFFLTANFNHCN